jgi:hypothetical protein
VSEKVTDFAMNKTVSFWGRISEKCIGESDPVLFVSDSSLIGDLEPLIKGKFVSVRYWISGEEKTKEEAEFDFIETLLGIADCELDIRYSEDTGYLWTNEDLLVGGHDLLSELKSFIGKWLILEIDISDDDPRAKP